MPDHGDAFKPEHIEPDYEYAADAWVELELTKETMRHRSTIVRIAFEYARRKDAEIRGID